MTSDIPPARETKEASAARLHRFFTAEASALQQQITRLSDTSTVGGERADAIEHCLAGIARLSDEVKDAAVVLPAYDVRVYADQIKSLTTLLTTTRASITPRSKFSFNKSGTTTGGGIRKQASALSLSDADFLRLRPPTTTVSSGTSSLANSYAPSPMRELSPYAEERVKKVEGDGVKVVVAEGPWGHGEGAVSGDAVGMDVRDGRAKGEEVEEQDLQWNVHPVTITPGRPFDISRLKNGHIVPRPSTSDINSTTNTTGTISHLSSTLLDLSTHSYTSLTLTNITSSIIITGPIHGPIHLTNITNSILLITQTRQFRMHHSSNVDVYLRVGSRPVIEQCSGLRFAPVPDEGGGDPQATNSVRTRQEDNLWDQVQDFNWLRAELNPHWSVLPVEERDAVDWVGLRRGDGGGKGVKEVIGRLGGRKAGG